MTPELIINDSSTLVLELLDEDGKEIIKPSETLKNSTEDVFLSFIAITTGLVISKNKLETSIVLPTTLRELSNSITFLYRNKNLEAFKTLFIEGIKNNLVEKEQIKLFLELEKTSDERLNQTILNWIGKLFDYTGATSIKRYYNATFGEVHGVLREFKRELKYTDTEKHFFINYLFIYYSIRYKQSFLKPITDSITTLFALTHGRIDSNLTKRLPKEGNTNPRDYFEITLKTHENFNLSFMRTSITKEMYFWLCNFFCFLGDGGNDYSILNREDDEILNRTIRKAGAPYTKVIFSPTAFILNILNPQYILSTYIKKEDENDILDCQLYKDLNCFNKKPDIKDYLEIFNINLYNEFINSLYTYSTSIDSFNNDGERIYNYIKIGIEKIAKELSGKYNLNLDVLYENPFFSYWEIHKTTIDEIITFIYTDLRKSKNTNESDDKLKKISSKANLELQELANEKLIYYNDILNLFALKQSDRGKKMAMTNLVGCFNKYPDVRKKLNASRKKMDLRMNTGINEINEILKEIANG